MTTKKDPDFLNSATDIQTFLGISATLFKQFVEWGLPVRYERGRYYANAQHLKAWHLQFTASRIEGEAPEESPV